MRRKREELSVKDLFPVEDYAMQTYGKYELIYQQDKNELCRFPELLELFAMGVCIEKGSGWDFFRLKPYGQGNTELPELKKVAQILYNAFSMSKNIAVVLRSGYVEVTSNNLYVNESFEVYRNRTLFELRDYLGIDHYGKGSDSVMLKSKYTGEGFQLV